jgi:pyrroline-5-carboxylate reductase
MNDEVPQDVESRPSVHLGLLGVGAIGESIVSGLCADEGDPIRIVLSPRSAERSRDLAARHAAVEVAPDNQAVVDHADVIVVAVRPQIAERVLKELTFPVDKPVISVVATIPSAVLQTWVEPGRLIARAVPLPAVATRRGLTAVWPANAQASQIFDRLGGTFDVSRETTLNDLSAVTGTIAAHFAYLAEIQEWLVGRGLDRAAAAQYVSSLYEPLALSLAPSPPDLSTLASGHTTPGGLNEHFLALLHARGASSAIHESLDELGHWTDPDPPSS